MSLLESVGVRAYSDSGPSAPAPSEPPSVESDGSGDGRRLSPSKTLQEKRRAWGKEWGRINSEIGQQLRERGK